MAGKPAQAHRVAITTNTGILSFPRLFASTAGKNDKGEIVYDLQFLIPKSDKEGVRKILAAIQEVGKAKFGDNWKKVRRPLRDGDAEAGDLTEDGQTTKGEKYPERLGHYFLNAKTSRPVAVFARDKSLITDAGEIYGGVKAKVALTFYPYAVQGNLGIAAGLEGVQKVSDGEPFGGTGGVGNASSMFDELEDEDDIDLDEDEDDVDVEDEEEVEEAPAPKKRAARKAPAKAKAKAKPVVEDDEDDLLDDLDDDI